jgi:hypothetical protein
MSKLNFMPQSGWNITTDGIKQQQQMWCMCMYLIKG